MVADSYEAGIFAILFAEVVEVSDGAIQSHQIIKVEINQGACIEEFHRNSRTREQAEVRIESACTKGFNEAIHESLKVAVNAIKEEVGFVEIWPPNIPVREASNDCGVAEVFY
jgi:hypothetical protein